MSFAITAEQEELRGVLRQFLTKRFPSAEIRRLMATEDGFDATFWRRMAEELGLAALGIPQAYGGAGFGPLELAIVFEELGRALVVAPFFSSVALAAPLLLSLDDEPAKQEWLPRIADGTLRATVALSEPEQRDDWRLAGLTTTATRTAAGWQLNGVKTRVIDGHTADLLLVIARIATDETDGRAATDELDGAVGVFAVDTAAAGPATDGLLRTPIQALDATRKLARLDFTAVGARLLHSDNAATAVRHGLDIAITALAAEQAGGARRCLDDAVEYAKIRVQFGKPIGSFQSIKHKCADLLMAVESARSAAYYAAWTAAESSPELSQAASVAKAFCSQTYLQAATGSIQIHGGIGFTWEHDAHLYLRRAKASQQLFGDPEQHGRRVADLVGF